MRSHNDVDNSLGRFTVGVVGSMGLVTREKSRVDNDEEKK